MKISLTKPQEFITQEIWILAWNASVQRAKLYKAGLDPEQRKASAFRSSVIHYVENEILHIYKEECSEEQHYKNIQSLIEKANQVGSSVLGEKGYKYGVAQKLLNLIVKYMWCLGHIKEPPHCPVDRIIIEKTSYKGKINWTEITSKDQYKQVINEIKTISNNHEMTPAQWELQCYARR